MERTVLVGELAISRRYPIAGVITVISGNGLVSRTQIPGFQPRENGNVDIIVPCVIPPARHGGVAVQPIAARQESLVTLHIRSR